MRAHFWIIACIIGIAHTYDLPDDYESKTAEEKQTEMWNVISSASRRSGRYPFLHELGYFSCCESVTATMDHSEDTLPYSHGKRIHSVGGVGKALWKSVGDHSYTGLFQGETTAMVRFSLATAASWTGTTPGIGVKLFRDGMSSANFVAMESLSGQDSGNFFERTFSNHIPAPESGTVLSQLADKFAEASSPPTMVGLSDIASFDQSGVHVSTYPNATSDNTTIASTVNFPFKLKLVPNAVLTDRFEGSSPWTSLKSLLESIDPGTKMWDVYAISEPNDDVPIKIAELISSSEITYSKAGDEFLFFRHQKMMDDVALRPEWADAINGGGRRLSPCPHLRGLGA